MADRRITRQDMKRDEVRDFFSQVVEYVEKNWQKVLGAIGGGLALILVIYAVMGWMSSARADADAAVGIAAAKLSAPVVAPGTPDSDPARQAGVTFPTAKARDEAALTAIDAAASSASGTNASLLSYYRGIALIRLDRGGEAVDSLQKAVDGLSEPTMKNLAKQALGSAARQKGDYAKAEQMFRELSTGTASGYPQDVALNDLARTLDAEGKTKEAEDVRQQIVRDFADSSIAQDIPA